MKVLFIVDPLEKLKTEWDTTLLIMSEFCRRGHETWFCDVCDMTPEGDDNVLARVTKLKKVADKITRNPFTGTHFTRDFTNAESKTLEISEFDLILNRKEPPVNEEYKRLLTLLEMVADRVRVENNCEGIRMTNEKLSILEFPQFLAPTLVTKDWDEILAFQKELDSDLVIKPLNNKGGTGVHKFKRGEKPKGSLDEPVMVQKVLPGGDKGQDKRIFFLDGEFWVAAERHPQPGEFRTNLSFGGVYHKTTLTPREEEIVAAISPFLKERKLQFVGIDVMSECLLEINVTCTGGLCETTQLYPERGLVEALVDSLERPRLSAV